MPLILPDDLPANGQLRSENVFIMNETQAVHQDIRPLKIVILNLMPLKITTERHILRLLSNSPLQVEIDLLRTETHTSRNTPTDHMDRFYKTFDQIESGNFDGMIITGAPVVSSLKTPLMILGISGSLLGVVPLAPLLRLAKSA